MANVSEPVGSTNDIVNHRLSAADDSVVQARLILRGYSHYHAGSRLGQPTQLIRSARQHQLLLGYDYNGLAIDRQSDFNFVHRLRAHEVGYKFVSRLITAVTVFQR